MGSSGSKKQREDSSRYGQIYIQTDKPSYCPGETVNGVVYLNLLEMYPGTQLFIKFKGKEFATFVRNEQSGKHRHEYLYKDSVDLIKQSSPIYVSDPFLPGQFSIPFAFMLPQGLPASFSQKGHRFLAHVTYYLEAFIQPATPTGPKLKYKQNLIVRDWIKNPLQNYSQEVTTQITTCCCCGKGSNVLRATFDKNCYAPGEQALVTVQLDNRSSEIANLNIKFALKHKLILNAKGKTETKDFVNTSSQLRGVAAGSSGNIDTVTLQLPPFEGDITRLDQQKIEKYDLIAQKDNNLVLSSTTKGKLITSEYYLEVSCEMDGCCCTTVPSIRCPIEIYHPELNLPQITAPSNWAPTQVPSVNVAFAPPMNYGTGYVMVPDSTMVNPQMVPQTQNMDYTSRTVDAFNVTETNDVYGGDYYRVKN